VRMESENNRISGKNGWLSLKKIIIAVSFLLVFSCVATPFVVLWNNPFLQPSRKIEEVGNEITPERLEQCAKLLHVKWPSSVRPLGFQYTDGFLDDSMILKVSLPADHLQQFISQSPFVTQELRSDQHPMLWHSSGGPNWWNTHEVKEFSYGETWLEGARFVRLLIDRSDLKIIVLYLTWNET
jgi:hypothetical protein